MQTSTCIFFNALFFHFQPTVPRNIQPQPISVIQIPQQPQIIQMPIQMPIQQMSQHQPQYIILQPQPIIEPPQPIILNFPAFFPSSGGGNNTLSLPSQQNIRLQSSSHQNPPFFVSNSTTEIIPQQISSSVHPIITFPNFYNASS